MTSVARKLIAGLIALAPLVVATFPAGAEAPAAPVASGPIDIQANEQEFAGSEVIAKGNVHVKYKDSVVLGPNARLLKDASGNPQRAVFTGHPHLTQGNNKIDSDTLIFEVSNSKVIADGNAHSEVIDNNSSDDNKKLTPTTKSGSGAKNGAWPFGDGQKPLAGTAIIPSASYPAPSAGTSASGSTTSDSTSTGATAPGATASGAAPATATKAPAEKIITDSDHQEYDRSTGKFFATGHVKVIHGDIYVKADKLDLIYGLDNKPETARFTGHVAATQDKNTTLADSMIYSLTTRRLQATGHVKSTVIQENKQPIGGAKKTVSMDPMGMPAATAAEKKAPTADDILTITSDTQDYSRDTNRMAANGNVHFYYQDMTGAGPACVMIRNSMNKAERIVFSGRSQISQPNKRWIADRIEMILADKLVIATGNTRAIILKAPPPKYAPPSAPEPNSQLAMPPKSPVEQNAQLAMPPKSLPKDKDHTL